MLFQHTEAKKSLAFAGDWVHASIYLGSTLGKVYGFKSLIIS